MMGSRLTVNWLGDLPWDKFLMTDAMWEALEECPVRDVEEKYGEQKRYSESEIIKLVYIVVVQHLIPKW